jgi:hypothetical protein
MAALRGAGEAAMITRFYVIGTAWVLVIAAAILAAGWGW